MCAIVPALLLEGVPAWLQVTAAVLAIPGTVIGIPYSIVLLRKTSLESKKTELEILEKLRSLGLEDHDAAGATLLDDHSPIKSYRVSSLILRYILFQLIVSLSGLVTAPIQLAVSGLILGSMWLLGGSHLTATLSAAAALVTTLTSSVVYWVLFFLIGWPLFRDILAFFGISTRDLGWRSVWRAGQQWRPLLKRVTGGEADRSARAE